MDHMTTSMWMDEDRSHMTERILNLTLEIIYLLTGESFPAVKSGDHVTITLPPPHSLTIEKNSNIKILEIINKIIVLLTGEVPIRCQDAYFSMEEWEYLDGHKDLCKKVMMENQPSLTSPDGSSNRNPPEGCPRPLYSRDSTQKDLTIPHHDQIVVKEEYKEENEKYGVMRELSEGHKDLYKDIMMEPPSHRDPPERCPCPLYSRDPTQEDLTIPDHDQSGNLGDYNIVVKEEVKMEHEDDGMKKELSEGRKDLHKDIMMEPSNNRNPPERCPRPLYSRDPTQKDLTIPHHDQREDEEEEMNVRGGQQSVEKVGMTVTSKTEESSLDITTGGQAVLHNFEGYLILSVDGIAEDTRISQCSPDRVEPHPSNPKEPSSSKRDTVSRREMFPCSKCDRAFTTRSSLVVHETAHSSKKDNFTCLECGKSFNGKSALSRHEMRHTGERPYPCVECGKTFISKSDLSRHHGQHTGERPYLCTECGKCFREKSDLKQHLKIHTGEKPFPCPECGQRFRRRTHLMGHLSMHTGETFSCSECTKCFKRKDSLLMHQRTHRRNMTYTCTECGKGFTEKGKLLVHQGTHTTHKQNTDM